MSLNSLLSRSIFFLFAAPVVLAQDTLRLKIKMQRREAHEKEVRYFWQPGLSLDAGYSYRKQDSTIARAAALQYFKNRFPSSLLDSFPNSTYTSRYVISPVYLKTRFFVDSISADLFWRPFRDRISFRLSNIKVVKGKKMKSLDAFLQSTTRRKKEAVLDDLHQELAEISNTLEIANDYTQQDLKCIHFYSLHSRYPLLIPDTLASRQHQYSRDSLGIFNTKEDLPLDTLLLPFLKNWLQISQRHEEIVFCEYNPHHFINFYDSSQKQIVGYVEICFECGEYRLSLFPLHYQKSGMLANDEQEYLKTQLRKAGIKRIE